MFSYSVLNAFFLIPVLCIVALSARRRRVSGTKGLPFFRAVGTVLALVLLDTLIFDNVLIAIGIVGYDQTKILGVRLGIAPLEDFGYAVAAAAGLPSLWGLVERRRPRRDSPRASKPQKVSK